jgi:hypothetical protein
LGTAVASVTPSGRRSAAAAVSSVGLMIAAISADGVTGRPS